jgi:thioredoxin-like negative regulator of GroEL
MAEEATMTSAAAVGPVPHEHGTGHKAPSLLELGRRLLEEGDYAGARLALQRRLRLAPSDPEARLMLAQTLLRTGDVARAAALLEPSRSTVEPQTCLEIGEALLPSDPGAAATWLQAAVDADPGNEALRVRLAQALAAVEGPARRTGRHRLQRSWLRRS